jgi:hypothetical protein
LIPIDRFWENEAPSDAARETPRVISILILIALLTAPLAAHAAEALTSSDCAKCHVGAEPVAGERAADYPKTLHHIDWAAFKASIHARSGLGCTDCHAQGYAAYPHTRVKLMTCFDCHTATEGEFQAIRASQAASVHGDVLACRDCHDPHSMKKAAEQGTADKDRPCIACHQNPSRTGGRSLVQLHAWHPQAALHLRHVPCIACHTKPEAGNAGFSHRIRPAREASRRCEECHSPNGKMVYYLGRLGHTPSAKSGAEMVRQFYISGSTRAPGLDRFGLGLLGIVAIAVVGHGSLRIARRKKR